METQGNNFGQIMKRVRLTKRDSKGKPQPWTQFQLHIASGISEAAISQIERGRTPQMGTRIRLASALDSKELMPRDFQ